MIKLSAEAKAKYAQYVGPDGKLIINDSLPEDLKETFKFFNDRNINILEMNINDEIEVLEDEPDVSDNDGIEDLEEETENLSDSVDNLIEEDSEVNLDDLNDLFT